MKKLVFNFKSQDTKKRIISKNALGGKGTNLAEMKRLGLPVPPGFTISTEVCDMFYKNKRKLNSKILKEIKKEMKNELLNLYKKLSPYPEVKECLEELKSKKKLK